MLVTIFSISQYNMYYSVNYPQYVLNWILEVIFPVRCIECGKFNEKKYKNYLCKKCLGTIPLSGQLYCIGCKRPSPLGKTCSLCRINIPLDQLLVVSDYKTPIVIKLIKLFKYRFIQDLKYPLSLITKKYLINLAKNKAFSILEENPLLLPVPLNTRRENWRGFNQSWLLTELIAEYFQMDTANDAILRRKNSKPQAEIEEKDIRVKNADGLFIVSRPEKIKNRTILLIDDVCTTGATINECARILKESGAKKVIGLVVARG